MIDRRPGVTKKPQPESTTPRWPTSKETDDTRKRMPGKGGRRGS